MGNAGRRNSNGPGCRARRARRRSEWLANRPEGSWAGVARAGLGRCTNVNRCPAHTNLRGLLSVLGQTLNLAIRTAEARLGDSGTPAGPAPGSHPSPASAGDRDSEPESRAEPEMPRAVTVAPG